MKYLALAAAGAAVIGLAACSQTTAHTAASPSPRAAAAVAPVSCRQQYNAWTRGQGTRLIAALDAVSSAETAGNPHELTTSLRKARPAVTRAARYPMPACADPRGYWDALLMHVNAAAASSSSVSSVRAAMRGVPEIEHELTAEVKRTAQ